MSYTLIGFVMSLTAEASTLCPNGTYVGGNKCTLCPDGSYVGGDKCELAPDGTYVGVKNTRREIHAAPRTKGWLKKQQRLQADQQDDED